MKVFLTGEGHRGYRCVAAGEAMDRDLRRLARLRRRIDEKHRAHLRLVWR